MMPGNLKGCTRGIFGLKSWDPLRKPGTPTGGSRPTGDNKADPRTGRAMIVKYTYKANLDSPIGPELSCKQLEKLMFVAACADNEHWWLARNEKGDDGYVPASYMQLEENKSSSQLPWLSNKQLQEPHKEPEEPVEMTYRPYQSAYDSSGAPNNSATNFRCDICDKTFNGPQPYRAHMVSKAHKEMVDYMSQS